MGYLLLEMYAWRAVGTLWGPVSALGDVCMARRGYTLGPSICSWRCMHGAPWVHFGAQYLLLEMYAWRAVGTLWGPVSALGDVCMARRGYTLGPSICPWRCMHGAPWVHFGA